MKNTCTKCSAAIPDEKRGYFARLNQITQQPVFYCSRECFDIGRLAFKRSGAGTSR